MRAGLLPSSAARRDPGHGRRRPTIEADLALSVSSFSVSQKLVLSSALCFLGDSDLRMQWAEVLGLALLGTGHRCYLLDHRDADRATEPGMQGCSFPDAVLRPAPPSPVNVLCVGLDGQAQPATGNSGTLLDETQPLMSRNFSSEIKRCCDFCGAHGR